jgi:DNA-binding HxlR family transcriptional regulator
VQSLELFVQFLHLYVRRDAPTLARMEYLQVCPVSLASEVIAERWTPLILREIVLFKRHHFSEIQHGVGRISQSLLSTRLRTLEAAGVIERRPNSFGRGWEYHPTPAGAELEQVLNDLGVWAQHWVELKQEHCDPAYLMTMVYDLLRPDRLPHTPTTVRFEFTVQPKIYWLVMGESQPELCYYDPGRDIDMVVTVDEQEFAKVLLGRARYDDALRAGSIKLDGPPALVRAFPTWLYDSRFAKHGVKAPDAQPWTAPAQAAAV